MLAVILQLQRVHKLSIGIDGLWGMHLQCAFGDQLNSSTQVDRLDVCWRGMLDKDFGQEAFWAHRHGFFQTSPINLPIVSVSSVSSQLHLRNAE